MPTLYTLSLSRHVRGMVKGPVKAVPSVIAGHYRYEENDIVKPDPDAIRACLPACYRAAWDRSNGVIGFPSDNDKPAHVALYSTRGKWLNTLYCQPYSFNA